MPDREIASRYQMGRSIGEGGMGEVFLGHDTKLDRQVAIKKLRRDLARDSHGLERLAKEVKLQARIADRRHVVEVYDLVLEDGEVHLVMEYVPDSRSLRDLMTEAAVGAAGGPTPAQAMDWFRQTALGLAAVHGAGVVHGDVKAENFLVGAGGQLKLADFGLARLHSEGSLRTLTMGTARNVAPEVFEGRLLPQSDVYALGMTAYELLIGSTAFAAEFAGQVSADRPDLAWMRWHCDVQKRALPAHEVVPSVPLKLSTLVAAMLEKETTRRATLPQVLAALDAAAEPLVAGSPTAVPAPVVPARKAALRGASRTTPLPAERPRRRTPSRTATAIGGLAVLLAAGLSWQQGWFGPTAHGSENGVGTEANGRGKTAADTTAPVCSIDGALERVHAGPEVALAGSVSDDVDGVSVEVQGRTADVEPGSGPRRWTASVTLAHGRNDIAVVAVDAAGNRSTEQRLLVWRDSMEPVLELPAWPVAPIAAAACWLEGMVTDDHGIATLRVASVEVPGVAGEYTSFPFRVEVPLPVEGQNQILLEVVDLAGLRHAMTLDVVRDTTKPRLQVVSPKANSWVLAGMIGVEAWATDEHGAVVVTVDGQPANFRDGRFLADVLATGELKIDAADRAGNRTSLVIPLRVDTGVPQVQVLKTQSGTVPFTLRGQTRDDGELVSVMVDGRPARLAAGTNGWQSFELLLDKPMDRDVLVVAEDRAGRRTEESVRLRIAAAAPAAVVGASGAGGADGGDPGRREDERAAKPLLRVPGWAMLKQEVPTEDDMPDAELRKQIGQTGLAWRVVSKAGLSRGPEIEFVLIPPGSYERGAVDGDELAYPDEKPRHKVTISKPFYLSRTEVTNAQFRLLDQQHGGAAKDDLPVVDVSWSDAMRFCEQFAFRLPSEAEWEYACRAKSRSVWPWGDQPGLVTRRANSAMPDDNYAGPAPVGAFPPNGFGLCDMVGNVAEWCSDPFEPAEYDRCTGGVIDPLGVFSSGEQGAARLSGRRVVRGGSWRSAAGSCRISQRLSADATSRATHIGFRIVKDVGVR